MEKIKAREEAAELKRQAELKKLEAGYEGYMLRMARKMHGLLYKKKQIIESREVTKKVHSTADGKKSI